MGVPTPQGSRTARSADASALIGASSRAYGWLRKLLTFYGTAVTVAQLVPAVIALVVVFLSPTAWLSATLRRWVALGAVGGALIGALVLARAAGPGTLRGLVRGGSARRRRLAAVAWWGLGTAVVAAAAFRLHLAVVDVAFVRAVPFLTPVLDFYLGGGRGAATLYNALAAGLGGLTLAGVVAGAPAGILRWHEMRMVRRALLEDGGPVAALDQALAALEQAKVAVERSKSALLMTGEEPSTSGAAQPAHPAPRAGGRRSPR